MLGGKTSGQNVVHLQNMVFLLQTFLEVNILTTIYQKAFVRVLRPNAHCKVLFHSMTSDPTCCPLDSLYRITKFSAMDVIHGLSTRVEGEQRFYMLFHLISDCWSEHSF